MIEGIREEEGSRVRITGDDAEKEIGVGGGQKDERWRNCNVVIRVQ